MLHIVIVEDDPLAGKLLKEAVTGKGVVVDALYTSGEEAIEQISAARLPNIILMDVGLPGISGIETTAFLKQRFPKLEIIIQTVFEDSATILRAIKKGASGYILKASRADEILKALQDVSEGGSYLSASVARKIVADFQKEEKKPFSPETEKERPGLTRREAEILNGLTQGLSYKIIGYELEISYHTVNNHVRRIYEKLQVNSRGEAVARARSLAGK